MEAENHYHVDLFVGRRSRFFRGLTLQRIDAAEGDGPRPYRVLDDLGVLGPPEEWLSGPMPLEEALRVALELVYPAVEKPAYPCRLSAPWELLGYRYTRTERRLLGVVPLPGSYVCQAVGPDGRPEVVAAGAPDLTDGRRPS